MVMRRRVSIDVGDVDAIHAAAELQPRHVLRDVAIVAAILGAACLLINRAATVTDSSSPLVSHECLSIDVLNITCEGEHQRSFFDIHRESFGDSRSEGEEDEHDAGEDQPIRREAAKSHKSKKNRTNRYKLVTSSKSSAIIALSLSLP